MFQASPAPLVKSKDIFGNIGLNMGQSEPNTCERPAMWRTVKSIIEANDAVWGYNKGNLSPPVLTESELKRSLKLEPLRRRGQRERALIIAHTVSERLLMASAVLLYAEQGQREHTPIQTYIAQKIFLLFTPLLYLLLQIPIKGIMQLFISGDGFFSTDISGYATSPKGVYGDKAVVVATD